MPSLSLCYVIVLFCFVRQGLAVQPAPANYNVPEGSYSTNPANPVTRIREMKEMVKALHDAGIGVIMDVVYNHTAEGDTSNFSLTAPGYYYRYSDDGSYSNASGCGNETASERPQMRSFIVSSVKYWAKEYHLDGFRFEIGRASCRERV